jgi:hypothetical protein
MPHRENDGKHDRRQREQQRRRRPQPPAAHLAALAHFTLTALTPVMVPPPRQDFIT